MKTFSLAQVIFCYICISDWFFTSNGHGLGLENNRTVSKSVLVLREIIRGKLNSSHILLNYLDDDLYILQWLKANRFDISKAEAHFAAHLSWREKFQVDAMFDEDWARFFEEYPTFIDTFDKAGRPVGEMWFSEWNIRRAVISGLVRRLLRFQIYTMEVQQQRLFDIRRYNKNVTGAVAIQDFKGITVASHGCSSCLPAFSGMFDVWAREYPGIFERVYLLDFPVPFHQGLKLRKKEFTPAAAPDALQAFQRKSEWLPVLDAEIDRDQRSTRFGGTIIRNV